jgi:hypothetical protein
VSNLRRCGLDILQIPVVKEQKPKTPALTKTLEFHFCTETRSRVHATDHVTPLPTVKVIIIVHPSLKMFELAPPFFLLLVIGTPYDSAASDEEVGLRSRHCKGVNQFK